MDARSKSTTRSSLDVLPVETVLEIIRFHLLECASFPLVYMRRVEELRLVNRYWAKCINDCPTFWTQITSEAQRERYTRWLEKSQTAPLRVDCRSDDGFMDLLVPETHRWRSMNFWSSSINAWDRLSLPAPQLRELQLDGLPGDDPPEELFQGVVPCLSRVRLYAIAVPWASNILRGLRELVLAGTCFGGFANVVPLDRLLEALQTSPRLEVLAITSRIDPVTIFIDSAPDVVALTSLRLFHLQCPRQIPPMWFMGPFLLLRSIRMPNCTAVKLKWDPSYTPGAGYPPGLWPAVGEVLRNVSALDINLNPSRLTISTRPGSTPSFDAEFTHTGSGELILIDILKETESTEALSAEVHLTVESQDVFPRILEFLMKPRESEVERLPRLRKLYVRLHIVPLDIIREIILHHQELDSVLWSRVLNIGEGWSGPEEIKDRVLQAPPHQRWFR